jgi:single-strand DNA-binding protein
MTKDCSITLTGNLTRDPETKYSTAGNAVTKLGLAVNYRKKDGDNWVDDPSFFNLTAFGEMGEHIESSLTKGTRVVVCGRLVQRTWETDEGEKRSSVEIIVDEIGPSLRWATAAVTRAERETVGGSKPNTDAGFDGEPF